MLRKAILVISIFILGQLCLAQGEESSFTFVQLCDTQLGMGGYEHDILEFEQAVVQINSLQPDFVVICGDLVHDAADSSYQEFKRIKNDFQMDCYSASGNHDVGNVPNKASLAYYRRTIGKDYYSFTNKGYTFVVTNTQLWKVRVRNESKKHHQWFSDTLNNLDNSPVFVIGHYPIFINTPNEKEEYFNLPKRQRKKILTLFKEHNVKAYLSGHKHETLINEYENIQLVSGETTSKNFDERPLGFRLWDVSKDSITHQFIPLTHK